jgi:filamentous hemagglutinin family protein
VKAKVRMLLLAQGMAIALSPHGLAQVVPDQTLPGGERSRVSGDRDAQIDGGVVRGNNLFHSFHQFSIPTGGSASFNNASDIRNIITRVTGNNSSDIDGIIRANGTANLFLINPNGILFGANARLEIGGSFLASTADSLRFADGFAFSATSPQSSPLLTISAPIGLQTGINPGRIRVQGQGNGQGGLEVGAGQTLALVGGDVRLENAQLTALGGRVELGGLSEPGAIGLTMDGNSPRLEFPANVARSDASLTNNSQIDVAAGNGGSVTITTRNLDLNRSSINAGIGEGLRTLESQAGDVVIDATGSIALFDSQILNNVRTASTGQGGNIRINTRSLSLTNAAQLNTSTFGEGNAGDVIIEAQDTVSFDGANSDDDRSGAFSRVEAGGIGQGGNIRIGTRSFSLSNSAVLTASTFGKGDAGDVIIEAQDAVSFRGTSPNSIFSSDALSGVGRGGIGQGGNIRISTRSLVLNSALLSASTRGRGDAGAIIIEARDTVFRRGSISSEVGADAVGQGGDIRISTGSLVLNNANLVTDTGGQGDAGDVIINARGNASIIGSISSGVGSDGVGRGGNIRISIGSLALRDSLLGSSVLGEGASGDVIIEAQDTVSFDNTSAFSDVLTGVGRGGTIRINTRSLFLTNGAQLITGTWGEGASGDVIIEAQDTVSFDGTGPSGRFSNNSGGSYSTGAFSNLLGNSTGRGGSIRITTGSLALTNGAQLITSTSGRGNAGNIIIEARDTVSFDGTTRARVSFDDVVGGIGGIIRDGRFRSGALSTVEPGAIGEGGNITVIAADSLALTDGAQISASSSGQGGAGNIRVNVPLVELDQSSITSETRAGNGGDMNFTVQNILLLRQGNISTTAGTVQAGGNGGNITFNAGFILAPQGTSNISANAFTGRGGNIDITTQGLFGIEPRDRATDGLSSITASSEFGISGTIALNTPDVDPIRGIAVLPTEIIDTNALIANSCVARRSRPGQFVITGTGGLAPQPDDLANSAFPTYELAPQPPVLSTSVIEADRIERTATGEIVLGRSCQ